MGVKALLVERDTGGTGGGDGRVCVCVCVLWVEKGWHAQVVYDIPTHDGPPPAQSTRTPIRHASRSTLDGVEPDAGNIESDAEFEAFEEAEEHGHPPADTLDTIEIIAEVPQATRGNSDAERAKRTPPPIRILDDGMHPAPNVPLPRKKKKNSAQERTNL